LHERWSHSQQMLREKLDEANSTIRREAWPRPARALRRRRKAVALTLEPSSWRADR